MKNLVSFVLIFIASINFAQTEIVPTETTKPFIKDTELKLIYSEEVKDTFYLYLKLPKGYAESSEKYPVIYLLDGDIAFPMATSIIRYQQFPKYVPDVIIVGIGYGTMMNDNEVNYRTRDYNPPNVVWRGTKGGGDKYLDFLSKELIPFIDQNYKTISNERFISGHSLSGQFAIYILLNEPTLFKGYIASSPHMVNSINSLLDQEYKMRHALENTEARIFISHGSEESDSTYGKPISIILERFNSRNFDGIKIKHKVFDEGSHFVCPPEAMSYGLKFVFEE